MRYRTVGLLTLGLLLVPAPAFPDGAATDTATEGGSGSGRGDGRVTQADEDVTEDGDLSILVGVEAVPGDEVAPSVVGTGEGRRGGGTPRSNLVSVEVPVLRLVPDPDGPEADPSYEGVCLGTTIVVTVEEAVQATIRHHERGIIASIKSILGRNVPLEDIPACIGTVGITPGDLTEALRGLEGQVVAQLPRPTPVVNPSTAVTGLDAYLMTNRPLTWEPPQPLTVTLGGFTLPVEASASATFTVDWGQDDDPGRAGPNDPAFWRHSGPHKRPGRDFDANQAPTTADAITHVYTSVPQDGPLAVSVTDRWTITYTVSGLGQIPGVDQDTLSGSLTAPMNPVAITIDVIEYQAVIQN